MSVTITKHHVSRELIDTLPKFEDALTYLKGGNDTVVMDTETNGLDTYRNHMVGIGLHSRERAFYLPFRHEPGGNLPLDLLPRVVREILRPDRPQMGHNYGFDIRMMRKDGMVQPKRIYDSQLRAHLHNENDFLKLETLAARYIDPDAGASEDALIDMIVGRYKGSRKSAKGKLWKLHPHETADYGCQDLITTRRLTEYFQPALEQAGLAQIADEVEAYQLHTLNMQATGILIDLEKLNRYSEQADQKAKAVAERICALVGHDVNCNSPIQMGRWLGLRSTSKGVLELIDSDKTRMLQDYRSWSKVRSTYYEPFREAMQADGRVHPNFNLTGTVTSRPVCNTPNCFAIPRSGTISAAMRQFKEIIVPPSGYVIVEFDWKQAEICIIAHYSRDDGYLEVIRSGLSLHDIVASKQDIPRPTAKMMNFLLQYGGGANLLSEKTGKDIMLCHDLVDGYRNKAFPGVTAFSAKVSKHAREKGFIRAWSGRIRRYNNQATAKKRGERFSSPKDAANFLAQGGVAEMQRVLITRLAKEVPEFLPCLSVYDSVIGFLPEHNWREPARHIKAIGEDQPWLDGISISMDCSMSPNSWADCKEVEL